MRLSSFIRHNVDPIVIEWVAFAQTLNPGSNMSKLQLQDHIKEILAFIADDIESNQSGAEQKSKSHGKSDSEGEASTAAEIHGTIRHSDGFDIVQMVAEFRALRASIIKLWTIDSKMFKAADLEDLTRFNESIDQSLAESVVTFTRKANYSRDLLLGIIGHDIRSPLGAIIMAAHLLSRVGELNEKQSSLAKQIEDSGVRITSIVSDLLDLTRARIGAGLPIHRQPMDMKILADQVAEEIRLQHSDTVIMLTAGGDTEGEWDSTRLGQVLSNLLSNAVQYGTKTTPVSLSIEGKKSDIVIKVNNKGKAIPPSQISTLFESFTRGEDSPQRPNILPNLGLGLFITKEVVKSHGGSINVTSNDADGTTFILKLPRRS